MYDVLQAIVLPLTQPERLAVAMSSLSLALISGWRGHSLVGSGSTATVTQAGSATASGIPGAY